jgi:competence protein ComEC
VDASREPVDVVLLAGVALAAGGLAVGPTWEVTTAAALVLILAIRAGRVRVSTVAIVAITMTVGVARARAAVERHERDRDRADAVFAQPARCSARGRVDSSPVLIRGSLRWDARLSNLECDGATVGWEGRATLYGGPETLARGDELEVVATLAPPQRLWNGATGDPRPAEALRDVVRTGGTLDVVWTYRARGLAAWIDRTRARVRRRIDVSFATDVAPMARALVLGESDLNPDDDRCFRASGLSHLLAVSGMHLVLVLAGAVRVLEGALVRVERVAARVDVGRMAAAIGIPVAWLYAELAGAGGSTLRAAWMATVGLAARALGRRTDATRAFGISMGAMALADPLIAFDLSFVLSAGATGGLLAFASPLGQALTSRVHSRLAPFARAVATTIAATIPCAPILARFAPTFPLGGVVANLLAVPLGESVALPLCLVHALLSWCPAAERGCAIVASGALLLVRATARLFAMPAITAQLPQPTSWQLVVLAVALGSIALGAANRAVLIALAAGALALLEVAARRAGAPRGVLRATFLDVGQGDGAIIDLPDGEAIVVDGGGLVGSPIDVGARVLAPELRARRRSAVAAVVLTHPHPDHFGGLVTGLDGVEVGAFWDTGQGEREQVAGGYADLLRGFRARQTAILRPAELCGSRALGGVRIEILAPCPAPSSDRNPNDNSFVIRIVYGARALLLVGDAEREEEGELLSTVGRDLRADVLKVGHHGSATSSSPAFLAATAPAEAIVSVGRRNRFGHPSPRTLAALGAAGARVWRTDRDGAVIVTTDGRAVDVQKLASSP